MLPLPQYLHHRRQSPPPSNPHFWGIVISTTAISSPIRITLVVVQIQLMEKASSSPPSKPVVSELQCGQSLLDWIYKNIRVTRFHRICAMSMKIRAVEIGLLIVPSMIDPHVYYHIIRLTFSFFLSFFLFRRVILLCFRFLFSNHQRNSGGCPPHQTMVWHPGQGYSCRLARTRQGLFLAVRWKPPKSQPGTVDRPAAAFHHK